MLRALRSLVEELEQDRSLDEPESLSRRVEALDRLEAFLLDGQSIDVETYHRARALCTRLEAANCELYETVRREIQRGAGRDILLAWGSQSGQKYDGYDYLDELVAGVLQFEEPGAAVVPLATEMVFYQPTPARHIFDLIGRGAFTERDVLIDLGSGLGHVAMLVSICTGARCIGIELEPAYIDCARRSADGLNLKNVTFVQQDSRMADLSTGTVFYLYTPFLGTILRTVLDSLRQEAATRSIRICTFGPCTPIVAEEEWLDPVGIVKTDRIAVFNSNQCRSR